MLIKKVRSILDEVGMRKDVFGGLLSGLVEAVHVELPDEAVDISVPEVFGKDGLLKLLDISDRELFAISRPMDYLCKLIILS